MADASFLDQKYFIDEHIYNCPFCNRRHVSYRIIDRFDFHWTVDKHCFGYLVKCESCSHQSMHLAFSEVSTRYVGEYVGESVYRYELSDEQRADLDSLFFYSVPTSFFVMDSRIPTKLRELLTEAEGCLKSNFLTGASACVRKVIYELAVMEKATGESYAERIKSLKAIKPEVDPTFFDTLLTIQHVTSTKVHEESYDGWSAKHLRLILSSLVEILSELYVIPAIRQEKRAAILKLKEEVVPRPKSEGAAVVPQSGANP